MDKMVKSCSHSVFRLGSKYDPDAILQNWGTVLRSIPISWIILPTNSVLIFLSKLRPRCPRVCWVLQVYSRMMWRKMASTQALHMSNPQRFVFSYSYFHHLSFSCTSGLSWATVYCVMPSLTCYKNNSLSSEFREWRLEVCFLREMPKYLWRFQSARLRRKIKLIEDSRRTKGQEDRAMEISRCLCRTPSFSFPSDIIEAAGLRCAQH